MGGACTSGVTSAANITHVAGAIGSNKTAGGFNAEDAAATAAAARDEDEDGEVPVV